MAIEELVQVTRPSLACSEATRSQSLLNCRQKLPKRLFSHLFSSTNLISHAGEPPTHHNHGSEHDRCISCANHQLMTQKK